MQFVKYHGLGNTFLIGLASRLPENPSKLAQTLCGAQSGLGVDGLIFGISCGDEDIETQMVLFNADGSRAEISGNGIRCLAHELFSQNGFIGPLLILTDAGVREIKFIEGNSDEALIEVNMGQVTFGPKIEFAHLGIVNDFDITQIGTVDVGNPHIVLQVRDISLVDIEVLGSTVESAWNDDGINVHVMEVISRDEIFILTWERGVGVTEACGSGAIASSASAYQWGLVGENVTVSMAGGEAYVSYHKEGFLLKGSSVRMNSHEVSISG